MFIAAQTSISELTFNAPEVGALVIAVITSALAVAKLLDKWSSSRNAELESTLSNQLAELGEDVGRVSSEFDAFRADRNEAWDKASHSLLRVEQEIARLVTRSELEAATEKVNVLSQRVAKLEAYVEMNGPPSGRHPAG